MKIKRIRTARGSIFTILELLLAVAIIYFLVYIGITRYFNNTAMDSQTKNFISEQGINTASPITVLDSSKQKLQAINKQALDREKELQDIK